MKPFSTLLASPAPVIGTWSQFAGAEVIDILGGSGFAFTIVDTEHDHFGLETAENLVRACDAAGLVPIVRIPTNEGSLITKALDIGAAAVLIPQISSAAEAERAVRAARYGPQGSRGACPCIRAGNHYVRDWRRFAADANGAGGAGIIALIETPEAVNAIDAILVVPGLQAVLTGPFDLSVTMGLDGDTAHPRISEALEHVAAASVRHQVPLILPLFQPDAADCRRRMREWRRLGVRLFTVGTDKLPFADYCSRYNQVLRTDAEY
ncbi:MAG: HpcH/HpaI aldolase family protein [Acidobacteriota bacterium]